MNTYEGAKRWIVVWAEDEWHVTESTHRPPSCRWEASRHDGTKSHFGATYLDLLNAIMAAYEPIA